MTKKNNAVAMDRHHLLWRRKDWNTGNTKLLRKHWYCIVKIPKRTLHTTIHHNLRSIPMPSGIAAKEAIKELEQLKKYGAISEQDDIEKRLLVLIAIFDCAEQDTADALKKQLEIVRAYKDQPPL